jgi:outer membrane lipoprotein-sorting protein
VRRFASATAATAAAVALATATATATPTPTPTDAGAEVRETIDGTKLDTLLTDIARARKGLTSLRASFVQERRLALLAATVKSTGQIAYVAPDRLRWELAPPDDVVYWIGPEGLSYRTHSSSATVPAAGANVGRALADLRALLGGDLAQLRDRYVLSATRGAAGDVAIEGVANTKNASVRGFTLVLDKSLVLPLRARLTEGKSDVIDVTFSGAAANVPIAPGAMRP